MPGPETKNIPSIIKHSKAINYCPLIINVIPHPLTRSHTLQSLSHSTNPSPSLTSSSKASGALWCAALMMSWRQRANSSMTSRMGSASRRSASSLLSTAAAMRHWHTASITSEVMKLHGCLLKTKLDYINNKSYVKLKRFKFKIFSLLFLQCHIHVWRLVLLLLFSYERRSDTWVNTVKKNIYMCNNMSTWRVRVRRAACRWAVRPVVGGLEARLGDGRAPGFPPHCDIRHTCRSTNTLS